MCVINLDATSWTKVLDFYDSLFAALGTPSWQGYGIAAAVDSLIWHRVHGFEPPYTIRIENLEKASDAVIKEVGLLQDCIARPRGEHIIRNGVDVDVKIEIGS